MKFLTTPHQFRLALKPNGFTLIELMIVVAIVGILASVAYPSYMSQVRKSRRSDAVQALMQVQQAQERWRANNSTYSSVLANTATAPDLPNGLGISSRTSSGYYDLAVPSATATGYVATATAVTGTSQAADTGCTTLTVTYGAKVDGTPTPGQTNYDPPACWSK